MNLTFPARNVNPTQLQAEIAAALDISAPYVDVYSDRLEVVGMVSEAKRTQVQQVIDAHVPNPDHGKAEDQREFERIRAKAVTVFAGQDTFTPTQVQKILAALVLRATR